MQALIKLYIYAPAHLHITISLFDKNEMNHIGIQIVFSFLFFHATKEQLNQNWYTTYIIIKCATSKY